MARGRIGAETQAKLMMLIYGEQFSGKSTIASQISYFKNANGKPFRVLYIDCESGSIDYYLSELKNDGIDIGNIYILYTQALSEVKYYIEKIKNNEDFYILDENGEETEEVVVDADGEPFRADAIVVDGTTILNLTVQNGLVEFSKKRNAVKAKKKEIVGDERYVMVEGAGMELKDYKTVTFKGQDFVLDLMGCGVHCIITARETDEKESKVDKNGEIKSVITGRKIPEGFKEIGYNVHTVLRMFRDKDTGIVCCHVEKDRSHAHKDNEIIENPTLLDWQNILEKTKNNQNFIIGNSLNEAIASEQKIFEREALKKIDEVDLVSSEIEIKPNKEKSTLEDKKKTVIQKISSLSPVKKKSFKEVLNNNNLPTKLSQITEIEIIEKISSLLDNF